MRYQLLEDISEWKEPEDVEDIEPVDTTCVKLQLLEDIYR